VAHLAAVKHLRNLRAVTLPNGLQTVIVPRPGAPVITASLGLHGGWASGAPGLAAAAQYAMRLNFEDSPSAYGIGVNIHFAADMGTATVSAGAANLARALEMLLFTLRAYDLDWPSDKFQTTLLPYLQRHESGPAGRLDRRYREALFHGHPSGRSPTPEEIAGTRKADLARWMERTLNPRNAVLVIVGDISVAEAEAAARHSFGGWSASGDAVAAPPGFVQPAPAAGATPPGFESPAGWLVVHRPGATQATVRLGCVLPLAEARLGAVNDIAADIADGDLTGALRRRLGSTYGVDVTASSFRGGGATLEVTTNINNGQLGPALAVLSKYWARVARGRIASARDLEISRGVLASGRLLAYERSSALANALLATWNLGWPLDSPDRYAEYLASATLDEVNATLSGCARHMVVAILGDEKTIRSALASAAAPSAAPAPAPDAPAATPAVDDQPDAL
jgi:predicted Zn-dependent peptidase